MKQKILIHDLDSGIQGVFIEEIESSELGYVYVRFVPFNSLPPKKIKMQRHIKRDFIHRVHYPSSEPGVIKDVVYIYSGEEGSIMKGVLGASSERKIQELTEENERLLYQVAASKTESEEARSGVQKTIAQNKNVGRTPFESSGSSNYDSRNNYPQNYNRSEYDRREDDTYRNN